MQNGLEYEPTPAKPVPPILTSRQAPFVGDLGLEDPMEAFTEAKASETPGAASQSLLKVMRHYHWNSMIPLASTRLLL